MKDEGKYQCMVSSRAGSSIEEFFLTVERNLVVFNFFNYSVVFLLEGKGKVFFCLETPVIDERDPPNKYVRTLNEPVKLFCAAEAKPTPAWKWFGPTSLPIQYNNSNDVYHQDISADGKSSTFHVSDRYYSSMCNGCCTVIFTLLLIF